MDTTSGVAIVFVGRPSMTVFNVAIGRVTGNVVHGTIIIVASIVAHIIASIVCILVLLSS